MWDKPGMIEHAIEEVLDLAAYLYTKLDQEKRVFINNEHSPALNMPVIYVAGPFRGKDSWEMEQNIRRAEALALEAWRLGCAVICPHANTRFFQGAADDAVWLDGDIAMLARCDAILMTPDWERSNGATAERAFAIARGIPALDSLADLRDWIDARRPKEVVA